MSSKRSYFYSQFVEFNGAAFIDQAKIDEALRQLLPNSYISRGRFSYPSRARLCDLVWNHMDQNHRPLIHNTYQQAARIFIDRNASFSLTRFGKWPIAIPVFDGYFEDNRFYQVMVLFGLVVVMCVIECNTDGSGTRMDINWSIASHRLLRFLHPFLSRRIHKLNDEQNQDDDPIREQRLALREAQYSFATDTPDFTNSNAVANNVKFPPLVGSHAISLQDLPQGQAQRVTLADRAYVIRRTESTLEVWPGICPHEGAAIGVEHINGATAKCAWHGLEFGSRRLGPGSSKIVICGATLELSGEYLKFGPAPV